MARAIRPKRRKLTPRQVLQIRSLYRQNRRGKPRVAHIDLAMKFGVSTQTISSILTGKTYADVKAPPRKAAAA